MDAGSTAIGIRHYYGETSTIAGNRVKDMIATGNGAAYGIYATSGFLATRNDITGYNTALSSCTSHDNAAMLPEI